MNVCFSQAIINWIYKTVAIWSVHVLSLGDINHPSISEEHQASIIKKIWKMQ